MSYRVDSSLSATDGSNSLVERCRSLEAALAQAQDFADALQRGVTASVFLLNVDADGVLRYVGFNQAHERLTGLSSEGVRGRRPTDLVPDVLTLGHALALERRYRNCVDMRTTVEYEEYLEIAGRPTWWVTSLSPLIDAEGRVARVVGSSWDITERKVAEDELRLAATVYERSREGIAIMDAERRFVQVNRAFSEVTGYQEPDIIGKPPWFFVTERHDESFYRAMWAVARGGGTWEGELWLTRQAGDLFPAWGQLSGVVDSSGVVKHYIGMFEDISARKAQEERILHLAQHDYLTGLPNRALLEDRLRQAIPLARRGGTRLAVLFLDLDRFKLINDSLGHAVGDELLKEVARRLRDCVRAEDTVSRQGGDEFVLLLQDLAGPEQAAAVAHKLFEVLARPVVVGDARLTVTTSVGISLFPEDGSDIAVLLKNADTAMYHAKSAGRNNFQFFTRDLHASVQARVALESRLRRAIREQEFVLYYQPWIDLRSDTVAGVEAFIRWQDPHGELVHPSSFIPVAEESGLILSIDEWVLRAACRQICDWRARGLLSMPISVNLSAAQLRQRTLVNAVDAALGASSLDPRALELEITETSIMGDVVGTTEVLETLHAMGVRLSVDDFGTGYSSLGYLRRLALDRLKIDRSLVQDVTEDADDGAITAAIIGMARTLGLRTLAEGVETHEQLDFLRSHGCDEAQGFLFCEPLPTVAFEAWLASRQR